MPIREGDSGWPRTPAEKIEVSEFFEAVPPRESEKLETDRIVSWPKERDDALLEHEQPIESAKLEVADPEEPMFVDASGDVSSSHLAVIMRCA